MCRERGQGVAEYVGILFLVVVMGFIILAVLGTQIEAVISTIQANTGVASFEAVTVEDVEAQEAVDTIAGLGGYSNLPMTEHALDGHAEEKWNARTIPGYLDTECWPHVDICEEGDFEVHWCQMNDKKAVALVIGHTIRQIVTGYMGNLKYWSQKCGN